jgi:hypothetical protein
MAAVAAGAVAPSAALNMWGMIELEKLAYAASLTPFIPAGVREYSREEVFKMLKEAPDPYEKFKEIAKAAIAKNEKLPQPWESLRVLIMPKLSEERLMRGKAYSKLDEGKKKALFYAALALEEALGVYRSALRKYAEERGEVVEKREAGEAPFKRVMYVADLKQIKQLAEKEEAAFENALNTLRKRLNEYAVKHGLRDLLDVKEDVARGLAEAEHRELSEFKDVSFGVKTYAALIAYRERALGRRSAFGAAAWHWLEVDGSAWLFYYAPWTAYLKAERARVVRSVAVEELVVEGLRRLFLRPGADRYRGFVEELTKGGKLALELVEEKTRRKTESYVFRLYRLEEGGGLKELGVKLRISKVGEGEGITYTLELNASWREFFAQGLEAGMKAAEVVGERLPVEDRFSYMGGWVDSDVAITRNKMGKRMLRMTTSHLWQMAETHALFDWSRIVGLRMTLTLEEPKLQVIVEAPLDRLDEAIRRSVEGGWLRMLSDKEGLEDLMYVKSWDGLKRWVADHWDDVVDAAVSRLREVLKEELKELLAPKGRDAPEGRKGGQEAPRDGENVWEVLRRRLETLRDRLNDDKMAREVVAPALLLMQAERLGVNETTLRYFGAVASGAISGDGYVSAAMRVVGLTSGKLEVALLWEAVLAAYSIKAKVRKAESGDAVLGFHVIVSGDDAVRLAGLYFLYGSPLLEGDEKIISHKLAEAVKLAAEGLDIRWEGLRRTSGGRVAADLIISVGGAAVKYNVYLRTTDILLQFQSSDRSRVEHAARLLRLAGVSAEVKKEGSRDVWYVMAHTGMLAAGRKELRKALAEIVRKAVKNGGVDADKAEGWLKKLEEGLTLKEGWPKYYVGLTEGALVVRFSSTNPDSIVREVQRLRERGLEEGKHFTVKMPKGGRNGYVRILREGLAYAAWLSVYGSGRQRELAAEFVEYILRRAEDAGKEVYEKAREIIEEGMSRGF